MIKQSNRPVYILYHNHCKDGFGAAFAAWLKFGDTAFYIPVEYGKPIPSLPAGAKVFIIDFSYERKDLLRLKKRCSQLLILDHHASAQKKLKNLKFAKFDLNQSGAALSWHYFHPQKPLPWLISYIQDRDLWKNSLPHSQVINLGLSAYPHDFKVWQRLTKNQLLKEGEIILRYQNELLKELLPTIKLVNFEGQPTAIVNGTNLVSDLGDLILTHFPMAKIALIYKDNWASNSRQWSMRSRTGESVDVSIIATKLGGGGHPHSAGFLTPLDHKLDFKKF